MSASLLSLEGVAINVPCALVTRTFLPRQSITQTGATFEEIEAFVAYLKSGIIKGKPSVGTLCLLAECSVDFNEKEEKFEPEWGSEKDLLKVAVDHNLFDFDKYVTELCSYFTLSELEGMGVRFSKDALNYVDEYAGAGGIVVSFIDLFDLGNHEFKEDYSTLVEYLEDEPDCNKYIDRLNMEYLSESLRCDVEDYGEGATCDFILSVIESNLTKARKVKLLGVVESDTDEINNIIKQVREGVDNIDLSYIENNGMWD